MICSKYLVIVILKIKTKKSTAYLSKFFWGVGVLSARVNLNTTPPPRRVRLFWSPPTEAKKAITQSLRSLEWMPFQVQIAKIVMEEDFPWAKLLKHSWKRRTRVSVTAFRTFHASSRASFFISWQYLKVFSLLGCKERKLDYIS